MPDSPRDQYDRRAARTAGQRRVQAVTTWTAAGSVVAAAVLTAVLAHSTTASATTSPSTTPQDQTGSGATNGGGITNGPDNTGGGQLQAPEFLPGVSSGSGGRHGSSGGS
ncbi:MAG TPA: hypothetical protein VH352_02260 [Pseudonocardiaceae bacterium]|nr:hypothetical protein [Pseudonocardiaceae bacterium]